MSLKLSLVGFEGGMKEWAALTSLGEGRGTLGRSSGLLTYVPYGRSQLEMSWPSTQGSSENLNTEEFEHNDSEDFSMFQFRGSRDKLCCQANLPLAFQMFL